MTSPNEEYAPPSMSVLASTAVSAPSLRGADAEMHLHRVATAVSVELLLPRERIRTGRPVTKASFAAQNSSPNGSLFPPNAPPTGGWMTRMRAGETPRTRDSSR